MLIAPLVPAHAIPTPDKSRAAVPAKAKKKIAMEVAVADPMKSTLGSFTPSVVNPSRAAAIRPQVERAFKFTPSGRTGDRKALTIGLTSRAAPPAVAETHVDTIRPVQTAYNVGGSIDWLRLLSGRGLYADRGGLWSAPRGRRPRSDLSRSQVADERARRRRDAVAYRDRSADSGQAHLARAGRRLFAELAPVAVGGRPLSDDHPRSIRACRARRTRACSSGLRLRSNPSCRPAGVRRRDRRGRALPARLALVRTSIARQSRQALHFPHLAP